MDHNGVKAITHASAFFAPILVPLIVWLLMGDRAVKSMALQALLFHIGMSILIGISILFSYILIGIPFLIVFGLMGVYYPIKGIIYSLQGRRFHYPFLRFV
jgi:predicted membrane protein